MTKLKDSALAQTADGRRCCASRIRPCNPLHLPDKRSMPNRSATIAPFCRGNPSANAIIDDGEATGTILNDDSEVADLDLTKSFAPEMIGKGDDASFTLVVTNNGPQTATNVVVTDDLPNELTLLGVGTTQGSCTTADPVVCSVGTLTVGSSATITIDVTFPKKFDSVTNTATATADQVDPTPASASATVDCMKKPKDPKPCRQVGLQ